MNPKDFFLKSPYGKPTIIGLGIILTFALLFFVELYLAQQQISRATDTFTTAQTTEINPESWFNKEQSDIWAEKWWISNQLAVAKLDSMSLGICFKDSTMQLLFKGLPLVKAPIRHMWPEHMFIDLDYKVAAKLFSKPTYIVSQKANLPKKVFRKVRVNEKGEAVPVDSVGLVGSNLSWIFFTENHLKIVVTGFGGDSLDLKPAVGMNLFTHHLTTLTEDFFYLKSYQPTLFIWLKDTDAKTIYKALPHRAAVIVGD